MDGEERDAGPLNSGDHENISELSTPRLPPVAPTTGSSILTTGVVQLIPVYEAVRHNSQKQHHLNMRGSFSGRSLASCTSSMSATMRSTGFGTLSNMIGTILDIPERMIISYGRLRLLEHEVLGKGAFGEVVLGELYPTASITRMRTPTISRAFNNVPLSPSVTSQACEGVFARAESFTEDGSYARLNSRFIGDERRELGKTTGGFPLSSGDKMKILNGNHCRSYSVEQFTQPLPSSTPRGHVMQPLTDIMSSQLTFDDDILAITTNSLQQSVVPFISTESEGNVGGQTWSDSRSSSTEETPKIVAVKRFDKARLSRRQKFITSFKTELQIASELSHPSIIKTHGVIEEETELLLVMDFAEGRTLQDYLNTRGLEDMFEMAPRFLADVVLGLEYLHASGIAHRDIKPCNMLLTADHHIKLADFGSACYLKDDAGNTFAGTAAYMSPEMVETGKASATSDLWALGCVLFQLFVGRPPFQGENRMFVLRKVKTFRNGDVDYPPYFPSEARDLVLRLLQRTPSDRLGSEETGGFAALKSHPFFAAIDWSQLHQTSNITLQGSNFSSEVKDLLKEGEKVLRCTVVLKKNKRFLKKLPRERLLVLTDLPRLLCVDKVKHTVNYTIPVTRELHAEVQTVEMFSVVVKGQRYEYIDPSKHADVWGMRINDLVKRRHSTSNSNDIICSPNKTTPVNSNKGNLNRMTPS
ncbi:PDK1-type [Trypanosoma melophagium]|uniref:PDK1-type n=1 Tax=Trypanosoma melophagium TaxID=715481 RepID=UPI00351A850C|nr:PDK1-type [Trypanosoma melophagium]